MSVPLIAIAGWAHPAEALQPIGEPLRDVADVQMRAAWEFDPHQPLPPRVFLLGWSLGGMLALEAAAAQPDRVQGLILVGTTARFTLTPDWAHGLPAGELRALSRALRNDLASGLRGFLALCAFGRSPLSVALQPLPALEAGLRYLAQKDLRPLLPKIGCPTLIVHAREDAVIPVGAGQALAAALPRARLVICDGVGHDLPVREPGRVAEPAREFIHACASS